MKIEVFKFVPVRMIDPKNNVRTSNGETLVVSKIVREGDQFVINGRPPSRTDGRFVVERVASDAEVKVVPSLIEEVGLMQHLDPNSAEWKSTTSRGGQVTITTEVDGWTLAISGPVASQIPVPSTQSATSSSAESITIGTAGTSDSTGSGE